LGAVNLKLLELIFKEYIAIIKRLEQEEKVQNNRIIIDKERFLKMLEAYPYLSVKHKIKIYKGFNFIVHDDKSYTLPVKEDGKTVRKVVFNYNTYLLLNELSDKY